jgi:haloalkane dehalogenase
MHMTTLRLLLDHLGLDSNLILVCQDWGGLIGLSVVKDMPDAFESLVIMNTGLPDGRPTKAIFNNAIAFLTWRLFAMLCGNRLPVKHLFRYVVGFPEDVAAAYDAPFPDCNHRAGAARWPLMVPLYRDDAVTVHMREARQCLQAWNKQMLLMFSDKVISLDNMLHTYNF